MALEAVMQQLEAKIGDFVEAHNKAETRVVELEARVKELEEQLESASVADQRLQELESQKDGLAERLEKVLAHIDKALAGNGDVD
jgi:chromosome segregation ATPase